MRLDEVNERLTQAQIMIEQINNITAEQETRLEVRLACQLRQPLWGLVQQTYGLRTPAAWLLAKADCVLMSCSGCIAMHCITAERSAVTCVLSLITASAS